MINQNNKQNNENSPYHLFSSPIKKGEEFSKPKLESKLELNAEENKKSEITEMIEKMKKYHDDLENQLYDTFQKTGLTFNYIKDYLDNPNNFSSGEWKRIQQERQIFLTSIAQGSGSVQIPSTSFVESEKNGEKKNSSIVSNPILEKNSEKSEKERKSKLLGARRNWIPVR